MRFLAALLTLTLTAALHAQGPADRSPASPQPPSQPPGGQPPSQQPPGGQPPSAPPGEPSLPSGAQPAPMQPGGAPPPVALKGDEHLTIVRVNVTNQPWDFVRPWGKRSPYSRRAIGAVLPGKRVLVTGELIANATYVEFETADGSQKTPAAIETVDYESNLAVLKPEDEKFLDGFKPAQFTTAKVGDTLSVWQLENTGTVLVTKGSMTTAEVSRYPIDETPLLVYRATASLQFRDSSFTLPVAKDDKLVGLVMRYDNNGKSIEVVPTPIIEHFLKDLAQAPYEGFPRAGMAFSNTRDPQLRRYVGLNGKSTGGVYVTDLFKGGPSEAAGLQKGDVIMSIDGMPVDQDGNYLDPDYGKIAVTHLLSTRHFHGDVLKFQLLRGGEAKEINVKIAHRSLDQYVVEPYVIDRAPRFFVLGGLVLQELSRQYLKEWGSDWVKKAPPELVYFDRYQTELFQNGPKKLVILTNVLPSPTTVGYEELGQIVVTKINGTPLESLADVPKALANATDGVHKIEMAGDPSTIYLDAAGVASGDAALSKNYRIPSLQRLD